MIPNGSNEAVARQLFFPLRGLSPQGSTVFLSGLQAFLLRQMLHLFSLHHWQK